MGTTVSALGFVNAGKSPAGKRGLNNTWLVTVGRKGAGPLMLSIPLPCIGRKTPTASAVHGWDEKEGWRKAQHCLLPSKLIQQMGFQTPPFPLHVPGVGVLGWVYAVLGRFSPHTMFFEAGMLTLPAQVAVSEVPPQARVSDQHLRAQETWKTSCPPAHHTGTATACSDPAQKQPLCTKHQGKNLQSSFSPTSKLLHYHIKSSG